MDAKKTMKVNVTTDEKIITAKVFPPSKEGAKLTEKLNARPKRDYKAARELSKRAGREKF